MSPKRSNALGDKFATNPVCVGPFMFKDRVAGDHITLTSRRTTTARRTSTSTRSSGRSSPTRPRGPRTCARATSTSARASPSTDLQSIAQTTSRCSLFKSTSIGYQGITVNIGNSNGPRQAAVHEHRHADREVVGPAAGVRARARPEGDQQGRLRRHGQSRLLPGCARHAVVRRDEGDPVQADGRRGGGEGRVQRVPASRPASPCT